MKTLPTVEGHRATLATVLATATFAAPALAQEPQDPQTSQSPPAAVGGRAGTDERIQALEQRVRELEQRPIGSGLGAGPRSDALHPQASQPQLGAGDTRSDWPKVNLTGVFHLDGGFQKQSATNVATLGDLGDGVGFRRARVAAAGELADNLTFIMELDFAQSQARLQDVWAQWANTPLGTVRIGRFRQPFGMTELTSVRNLPLLERPALAALSPFRQTGIMLSDEALDKRMTWAVSGYRFPSDNFGNVFEDSGYGTASRLTGLIVDGGDDGILVHLGGDYAHNTAGRQVLFASTNEFLLSQNSAVGPGGLSVQPFEGLTPFVNTGPLDVTSIDLFNFEAAAVQGSWALQGEARWAVVDLQGGGSAVFPGGYAAARWVLTGESIPYDRRGGVLGRVQPAQWFNPGGEGWGALEAVVRVSTIDLDGAFVPGPGRELTTVAAALNWYTTKNTRFQFEWIHGDLSDRMLGSSHSDTFAFRMQVDF